MALPSVLDEINRLFDELIRQPWGAAPRDVTPATIREVGDGWIVELHIEGLRAGDLIVRGQGRTLTITGHRRQERRHPTGAGWSHTRQEMSLHRTIMLPGEVDPDSIEATVEGATLTVHARRRRP